jgi:TetR/AcrR family transcriptional regulator
MDDNPDQNMEQAILQSAEKLFLEKGFAMTSTTEIAKDAGCNQALIHYYYRTKEKLFVAVFERKAAVFFSGFSTIDESAMSFEESLRLKIEAHFDMIRANPRLPFLIINELTTNPSRIESLKEGIGKIAAKVFFPLEARLKEEIATGRIRPIGAYDLVLSMLSLNVMFFLASPIVRTALSLGDEDYERAVEARRRESVETILRSLRP